MRARILAMLVALTAVMVACGGEERVGFNEDVGRIVARREEAATRTAEAALWTPTPAPTATATPDPATQAVLQVETSRVVTDGDDVVLVVGSVVNTGSAHATEVQVIADLIGVDGTSLLKKPTPPSGVMPDLPPGGKSAFRIEVLGVLSADLKEVQFSIAHGSEASAPREWLRPVVTVNEWTAERIAITVSNEEDSAIRYFRLLVAGYDAAGQIINVYDANTTAGYVMTPGQDLPLDGETQAGDPLPATIETYAWAASGDCVGLFAFLCERAD